MNEEEDIFILIQVGNFEAFESLNVVCRVPEKLQKQMWAIFWLQNAEYDVVARMSEGWICAVIQA